MGICVLQGLWHYPHSRDGFQSLNLLPQTLVSCLRVPIAFKTIRLHYIQIIKMLCSIYHHLHCLTVCYLIYLYTWRHDSLNDNHIQGYKHKLTNGKTNRKQLITQQLHFPIFQIKKNFFPFPKNYLKIKRGEKKKLFTNTVKAKNAKQILCLFSACDHLKGIFRRARLILALKWSFHSTWAVFSPKPLLADVSCLRAGRLHADGRLLQ